MITCTINGSKLTLDADPATPILWFVREHAGLTGTKFSCGKALCGACTVPLNGTPIRSWGVPISAAEGQSITTIEGISSNGLSPVQKAWIEHNVPQCGYCQSGQIMSATALLASNPAPTDEEIDVAMTGNICRCGTYPRIRAAIHTAARNMKNL